MTNTDHAISLVLEDVEELFTSRTPDPLRGRFDGRSGVEVLLDQVDPTPEPLIIDIAITQATDAGCTDAQVSHALNGYAAERIARVEAEKVRIRRLGLKELTFGLCFLALCLASASTLAAFEIGPGWFRDVVVEGLVIVGWIALWHPVDMLFFERLPLIREQRVLDRVRRAEVTLRWKRSSVESVDD